MSQGVQAFASQLGRLGYQIEIDGDWVIFEYTVPGGTYAGRMVTKGIRVPPNFPATTPHGIDFTPRFENRPINQNAGHPERSHPSRRWGNEGEHWSRPHPGWNAEPKKDVATYMAHVAELWMTT